MKVWPGIHQSAQEIKIEAFSIETDSPVCKAFSFVALASKNILKKKKGKTKPKQKQKTYAHPEAPGNSQLFYNEYIKLFIQTKASVLTILQDQSPCE